MAREERLSRVFVELADTLVSGFDVVEFLHMLTERCVELLDVGAAGVVLADQGGTLRVMASSDERAHTLELFEVQNEEGPCLDCVRSGEPVVNEPLHAEGNRWPAFSREARAAEFRFAHALPLRLRDQVLGALNLFSDEASRLGETGLVVGQALADVATIGLLQARAAEETRVLAEQLQGALNSRVIIEQAKGMLVEHAGVDLDAAFRLLRGYARNRNEYLSDVARALVDGALPADAVTSLLRGAETHR
jgi:transcriptional regulator with GAF, ATPase, and Fis domain